MCIVHKFGIYIFTLIEINILGENPFLFPILFQINFKYHTFLNLYYKINEKIFF